MSTKQLNQLAGWCAFGMAACLVVNGIVTFVEPFWLWEPSRLSTVLFGLGVLPAIHLKVAPVNKPLAWLVTLWGYLGFGAEAIRVLGLAEVNTVWLFFGGMAAWSLVVNLLGLRAKLWSPALAWVGIASGVLLLGVIVSTYVESLSILGQVSAGLGGVVLYPVWMVWQGTRLLKE